ncbi:MAG: SDR family NAD(P)-dependent oxidoreductase [Micromonosporaceae bacterium]
MSRKSERPATRSHAVPAVMAWKAAPGTASRARPHGSAECLGARLAAELLQAGAAEVYATSRVPGAAAGAAADPRVKTLTLDITDAASVRAAATAAPDVNVLVNNAGVLAFGGALDGDLESFDRDLRANYLGTLQVTRAFVPALERNAARRYRQRAHAHRPGPGPMAGYSASKAAAHSMTQALRAELRGRGITEMPPRASLRILR